MQAATIAHPGRARPVVLAEDAAAQVRRGPTACASVPTTVRCCRDCSPFHQCYRESRWRWCADDVNGSIGIGHPSVQSHTPEMHRPCPPQET